MYYRIFASIIFATLQLSSATKAVYVIEESNKLGLSRKYPILCKKTPELLYPASCLVQTHSGMGTGTLIAPNVVLTALHVLSGDVDTKNVNVNKVSVNNTSVTLWDNNKTIVKKVKKVNLFPWNGQHQDIALLTLETPITSIKPGVMRFVRPGEKLPSVSLMGFGFGGFLSKTPSSLDSDQAYSALHDKTWFPLFRRVDNITGNIKEIDNLQEPSKTKKPLPSNLEFALLTKKAHLGSGDSGSAVLDKNGQIIGIAVRGDLRLLNERFKEMQNICKEWKKRHTDYLHKNTHKQKEFSLAQNKIERIDSLIKMIKQEQINIKKKFKLIETSSVQEPIRSKEHSRKRLENKSKKTKPVKTKRVKHKKVKTKKVKHRRVKTKPVRNKGKSTLRRSELAKLPSKEDFAAIFTRHRKQTSETLLKKNLLSGVVLALDEVLLQKIQRIIKENKPS